MSQESLSTIHEFWFGPPADDTTTAKRQAPLWWAKNPEVDQQMRERFLPWLARAVEGALESWEKTGNGLLALILLTDQFPRNIHRGTPKSFASDELARKWAKLGLAPKLRRAQRPIERVFMLLPFEHSESIKDQELSVREFEELAAAADEASKEVFAGFAEYARRHREIIKRFGRFPHRNAILGRRTTPDEKAFLQEPGSSF